MMSDLNVKIPAAVQNVNTVQDAAARLRAAIESCGADSELAASRRLQLNKWIRHALAERAQPAWLVQREAAAQRGQ